MQLANTKYKRMLSEYVQPPIDPAIEEALNEFVAKRKSSQPDAFV
jgi:trimethylamine---corrinoid protein Co-methyltransferase